MQNMNLFYTLLLGFVILHFFWFVTNPRPFPQRIKEYYGKRTSRILLIEVVTLLPQIWSGLYAPLPATEFDQLLVTIGILIYFIGICISVWGKVTMNRLWGPPGEHDFSRQKELLTTGAFSVTRNPIYTGLFLVTFGFSFAVRSIFAPLLVILIVFFYKTVKKEEKMLEKHFGKKYLAYKSKVPRFL